MARTIRLILALTLAGTVAVGLSGSCPRGVPPSQQEPLMIMQTQSVALLGSVVVDMLVRPQPGQSKTKRLAVIGQDYGGGAVNSAAAANKAGARVAPLLIVGNDRMGEEAIEVLGDNSPLAKFARGMRETRLSVWIEGEDVCYTTRPSLRSKAFPEHFKDVVKTAGVTVVAPFAAEDVSLVRQALSQARTSILMLSAEQCAVPRLAYQAIRASDFVVLNGSEARALSGVASPVGAIQHLRRQTKSTVLVVTTPSGALAWDGRGGDWQFAPAVELAIRGSTRGSGDVFVGTLAAAVAEGHSLADAMRAGQAAAGRLLMGLPPAGLEELFSWYKSQTKVDIIAKLKKRRRVRRMSAVAVSIAGLVGVAAPLLWPVWR